MRILKAFIVLLLTIVLFSTNSFSQVGFSLGPKAGVTFTSFRGDHAEDVKSRTGWAGGLFANLSLLDFLSVQPEFLIHQKGATSRYNQYRNEIRVNYFEVPILLKIRLPLGQTVYPNIFAGPNFSYRVSGKYSSTDTENGDDRNISIDNVRRSDTGGIVGVGIDIEGQSIFFTIDARYGFGFNELGDHSYYLNLRNEDLTVLAGIGFRIGSTKMK